MGSHHIPADSPQAPGGKKKPSETRKCRFLHLLVCFAFRFLKKNRTFEVKKSAAAD